MITSEAASLMYGDHGKDVYACRSITLSIAENEFLGIIGPSGSGKSSLLYLLSGLKHPTGGSISFRGVDLALLGEEALGKLRLERFGFVFQQPYLLGYLSAHDNVLAGRAPGAPGPTPAELLESLGMGSKIHRLPHELSGGERQRVCVARALYGEPDVIFADEPTAALDHTNGVQVVTLLNKLRGSGSLVMVTHDPSMLADADRVVRLDDGELRTQETP